MALKILLADDSMTAQNMGKKILVDAGYDVVAVSNGAAAIKKVASERPDIAILDEYMPGYTGSEVCERIKAAAETSKIPVLLTVGKMEPFDPEKASKVHADGVMIKPFEASDLVAAVQSIAQRLLAPAPTTRSIDATVQLRSPGDTGRIAKPPAEPDHEDTLRLTAEQIKAFQDASYHEWAQTAEPQLEDGEKAAVATVPEMPVAPAVEEEHTVAIPAETAEMLRAALAAEPGEPATTPVVPRETPVYNAMSAAGVAAEHEILNGTTTPVAPIYEPAAPVQEAAVETTSVPVFYTPPVVAEPEPEPPSAPAFAVEPVLPAEAEAPVISVVSSKPVVQVPEALVEPVVEAVPIVPMEPVVSVEPVVPVVEAAPVTAAPVLETSAPKTPGPMPVAPAADLEPTSAPAVEIAAARAHELEITSPPQERGALVAQDPALITEAEDMAQFTTKFGVESAEPVHVGLTSDLSDEQLAAIISPPEEEAEVAEVPAAVAPEAMVEPEVVAAPEPVVAEEIPSIQAVEPAVVTEPIVMQAPEPEPVVEAPVVEAVTPEVVTPEFVEPEVALEPVVESVVAEPTIAAAEPAIEEPVMAAPAVIEPAVAEVAPEPEPEPVVAQALEAAPEPPVTAVAEIPAVEPEKPQQEEYVLHAVESALAAAAAVAVAAPTIGHVFHSEPQHLEEPVTAEPTTHVAEPPPVPHAEPIGDAALAEELAAAISRKETEERAQAAAEAAATAAMEHAAAETAAPAAESGLHALTDHRLADAVARAFESLKPQLITEIIKELSK